MEKTLLQPTKRSKVTLRNLPDSSTLPFGPNSAEVLSVLEKLQSSDNYDLLGILTAFDRQVESGSRKRLNQLRCKLSEVVKDPVNKLYQLSSGELGMGHDLTSALASTIYRPHIGELFTQADYDCLTKRMHSFLLLADNTKPGSAQRTIALNAIENGATAIDALLLARTALLS